MLLSKSQVIWGATHSSRINQNDPVRGVPQAAVVRSDKDLSGCFSWPRDQSVCDLKTCIEKEPVPSIFIAVSSEVEVASRQNKAAHKNIYSLSRRECFQMVVKSWFTFFVCMCGYRLCAPVFIMTLVSAWLSQSSMLSPTSRVSQRRFLNFFNLTQDSYQSKYEEAHVISVLVFLSLSLSGAVSSRAACEGDSVPPPCIEQCRACLELIFLKIPSQLLKCGLGGGCSKYMRHCSAGWQVLQSCNI